MERFLLALLLLFIVVAVAYPIWRRYSVGGGCGPCGTTTTPSSSTCFPSIPWTVKSGIIDLRGCTDDVYLFANKSRVHFIEELP